jgi:hypothetical protein
MPIVILIEPAAHRVVVVKREQIRFDFGAYLQAVFLAQFAPGCKPAAGRHIDEIGNIAGMTSRYSLTVPRMGTEPINPSV